MARSPGKILHRGVSHGTDAQGELRRLNEKLERSETYFRSIIENVTDLITILEADGTVRYISPSVRRVLGYEPADMIGRQFFELVHPDDLERVRAFIMEAIARGRRASLAAYRHRHKDGSWRQLESVGLNMLTEAAVSGIVVTSRDTTERVEMEGRYRSLFENMVEGFAHCRMLYEDGTPVDFVYLEVNRAFVPLTGLNDVTGKRASDLIPGIRETNPELIALYGRVATTGKSEHCEACVPALERWFSISAYGAGPSHFVAVFDNITERKRTEETLRRSETEYRSLVDQAPLGIYRSAPDGHFTKVNPALVAMLGYESSADLLELDIERDIFVDPAERTRLKEASALTPAPATAEMLWKRKDGSRITVRVHLHPVRKPTGEIDHFDGLVEDVTGQRSLEMQFQQAQKMEAVGRLAGGVAHDFNNLLTAIIGYSELVLRELRPDDRKRADVEEIHAAAHRATGLTRQLLAFSRKQVVQTRVLDLNYVVRAMEKMLRRLIGEDISLIIALSETQGTIRADPSHIEQVILNLAVNARDAMPGGGRLTIETANVDLDEVYAREHAGMTPGPYVMLAVSDTGVGMDAGILAHLFEPFFTTKEQGKGTGLGLSTVYGIVKQSGGWIWAYSEPGHGAMFKVYLPRLPDSVGSSEKAPTLDLVAGGHERVLVAEDDAGVRAVISRVLSQKGYSLLLAPDGRTALDMAHAHQGAIDLLVTDLVMPAMPGLELAGTIKAAWPGVRVLFMSGYTDDAVFRHGVLETGVHYLQKPFTAEGLARKVREVLDAAG